MLIKVSRSGRRQRFLSPTMRAVTKFFLSSLLRRVLFAALAISTENAEMETDFPYSATLEENNMILE